MENKKTVIISLQDDNDELKRLAESLDYVVVKIFVQHHSTPNRSFYIGKGKIEEVKEYLEGKGIDYVIVNGKLTPSQWYNMEKELNAIVYDRIRLILDIFADRAKRKEAKLQVKLAYLRYEKPYIKELVHKIRAGEHPGFMAGGEYEVANYYEMIKKQIKKIRKELEKIERERESHYEYRWKKGYYLVTIAGYTNAGKSSLLNNLTGENVKVEERLFSTLSTTTRAIKKRDAPILITDTVGFIKDIPHWLIDSFKSTLKGIELSDVVVLLVDISEENNTIVDKINLSVKEIMEINANQKIVIGFNKIDKISKKERDNKINALKEYIGNRPYVFLSAKTGEGIEELIKTIYHSLPGSVTMEINFPSRVERQDISFIFTKGVKVLYLSQLGDKIRISCSDQLKEKLMGKFIKKGAEVKIIQAV